MPLLSETVVLSPLIYLGHLIGVWMRWYFLRWIMFLFVTFFLFLPHFLWYRSHKIDFTQEIFLACALIVERENICT